MSISSLHTPVCLCVSPSDPLCPALLLPRSAVCRRSSVGQSVSVVRSGRRAQQQPPDSSRPGSAGSGADSPALVTTTLVTAPYITVTGTVQSRSDPCRPDPTCADPTRPVQTRPTRSVQTQPVYHRHRYRQTRPVQTRPTRADPTRTLCRRGAQCVCPPLLGPTGCVWCLADQIGAPSPDVIIVGVQNRRRVVCLWS